MPNPPNETAAEKATMDSVLAALTTEPRRAVLAYFRASPAQTASLDELAEYVATQQSVGADRPPEQVKVRLHHAGLPKLAAAGLVTYDARTTTVRRRDESPSAAQFALVRALLQ